MRSSHQWVMTLGLPLALGTACVVETRVPAASTVTVTSAPSTTFAEASGLRVWATRTWTGEPANLPRVMAPVRVTLENQGARTIRVTYRDFTFIGATGFRYPALPPFPLEEPTSLLAPVVETTPAALVSEGPVHPARPVAPPPPRPRVVVRPHYPAHHFAVARPWVHLFPGLVLWPFLWNWDAVTYHRAYASWPASLPTGDMIDHALPEGALEPGGRVSGYLYFQQAQRERTGAVELRLTDAQDLTPLGTLLLPLSGGP